MRIRLTSILIICFFSASLNNAYAQKNKTTDAQKAYAYDLSYPPAVCFFPLEKSRWNGYQLSSVDWKGITVYQKTSFVAEAISEIEKRTKASVEVPDKWRLYLALDQGVALAEKQFPGIELNMFSFLLGSLKTAKLIKWNKVASP